MKRIHIRNALIISAVFVFAVVGLALAHDEWGGRGGYGGHMMGYGGGYGGHMMGNGGGYGGHMMGPGYGPMMGPGNGSCYGDLSQEDANKLEAARDKFYDQTRELREKMDDKSYAIQKELNQPTPDRDKLKALQGDLSQLQSQFDTYALDYNLAVRGIVPNGGRDRAYAGGYRGRNCW
ncbi:MAG: periplasmic heavy metal sensor [Deltaproteobacteria bacterium]|jgi:Spy/CpxP family protein refolding chaperone|nr:periplasmic heavy metal sensor [Deltaproteobacteria bacterium]